MKNRSGEKIKLASIDELLGVVNEESAMEIEISKIHPFKNHPFKVLDDEKMQDLTDFYLHCRFFIYHTQQFINACQFNLFATSIFHFSKPPVLSSYMLRQLFLSGSACRCFFPLHWSQQLLQTSGSSIAGNGNQPIF